jgi:hypothetical protein
MIAGPKMDKELALNSAQPNSVGFMKELVRPALIDNM